MKHEWLWYWEIKPGVWYMTRDEDEADMALHLGHHVLGEKIDSPMLFCEGMI